MLNNTIYLVCDYDHAGYEQCMLYKINSSVCGLAAYL